MDYKQKYLKYKQKYIELKQQIGGTRNCLSINNHFKTQFLNYCVKLNIDRKYINKLLVSCKQLTNRTEYEKEISSFMEDKKIPKSDHEKIKNAILVFASQCSELNCKYFSNELEEADALNQFIEDFSSPLCKKDQFVLNKIDSTLKEQYNTYMNYCEDEDLTELNGDAKINFFNAKKEIQTKIYQDALSKEKNIPGTFKFFNNYIDDCVLLNKFKEDNPKRLDCTGFQKPEKK